MLLRSEDSGARAIQKRRGERESPWNMPLFMLISLEYSVPSEWFKIRVVFHWAILDVRNWTMIGDNLYISRHFNIQLWGTESNAFLESIHAAC